VNLLKNSIPVEQAQELVRIMQSKEKLVTLCGLSKEEIKLDFSGQHLGAGDAVLIANDISDMGALTSLNLSSNEIGQVAEGPLPGGWKSKQNKSLHIRWVRVEDGHEQSAYPGEVKPFGLIALANAIPGMGALTSLNLAFNGLDVEGAKIIAAVLLGCTYVPDYPLLT
jgi:hypothetical protein